MKCRFSFFMFMMILGIAFIAENIEAQVTVVLQQPPPYQFKVESMWKVTLINPNKITYTITLHGRATELNEGLIVDATTTAFTLPPGIKVINARELSPLKIKDSNPKYSDVVTRIGGVPTGDYEICVQVINLADYAILGEMCMQSQVINLTQIELLQPEDGAVFSSAESSNQKSLFGKVTPDELFKAEMNKIGRKIKDDKSMKISPGTREGDTEEMKDPKQRKISPGTREGDTEEMKDPKQRKFILGQENENNPNTDLKRKISPGTREGDTGEIDPRKKVQIETKNSGNRNASPLILTFSWLPPMPIPPGNRTTYSLKITEIYGRQSPYDAIRSNPHTIVMEKISSTIVQLPLAARRLLPGRSYAWTVNFYLNGAFLQESDARSFTIEDNVPENSKETAIAIKSTPNSVLKKTAGVSSISLDKNSSYDFPKNIGISGSSSYTIKNNSKQQMLYGNIFQDGNFSNKIAKILSSLFGDSDLETEETMDASNEKTAIKPFILSGDASLEYNYGDRVDPFSAIPKNNFNANINPGLKLYGLPFSANFLYSNQQDPNRQNINSFRLNFDFEAMRQGLALRLQNAVSELDASKLLKAEDIKKILNFSSAELDSAKALNSDELAKLKNSTEAEIAAAKKLKEDAINKIRNFTPVEIESLKSFSTDELNNLRNPRNLTDNLSNFASITGAEKFFMSILALGVGTNYPSYSEYTLNGVPVTGVNIEINPGIFYAAFTGSVNQRAIDNYSFSRNLFAGRIGLGKKESTHLYFTGLFAKDDESSAKLDSTNYYLTPKANYVLGTEAKMNLFSDKLTLESEGAFAVLTRDTREPTLENKAMPSWVANILDPRISTSFDYSYTGKLAFNNEASATKLSMGIKMVGPGYTSLGAPNLRTDQFGYEAKFEQRLFERRVSIGSFFKRYNDNLIEWKSSTTTTTAYGINFGFNFPRLPFIRFSYSPYSQANNDVNPLRKIDNTTSIYSLMTGYSYRIGTLNSSTSFAFSGQKTTSAGGINGYQSNSYMLTEAVTLSIPVSFMASWGLIQTTYGSFNSNLNNIDIGANAQVLEGLSIIAGMNIASEESKNSKTGFYLSTSVSKFQGIIFDLRAEQNIYSEQLYSYGDYREFLFSAALKVQW